MTKPIHINHLHMEKPANSHRIDFFEKENFKKEQFEDACDRIRSLQVLLTNNPTLAYSDVQGYVMKIVNLRRKAHRLCPDEILRNDIP